MYKVILFGGTTEGRTLAGLCQGRGIPVLYCVATREGAGQTAGLDNIAVHLGRLDSGEMELLIGAHTPALVVDATHPYAQQVSANIAAACARCAIVPLRVARAGGGGEMGSTFADLNSLIPWLAQTPGNIFSTVGASGARALATLPGYKDRVWMRILPSVESVQTCLSHGIPTNRLICMQGPFSLEINRAMFQETGARILITKDSGTAGGFWEKIQAAQSLDMDIAILGKPEEDGGLSVEETFQKILEGMG